MSWWGKLLGGGFGFAISGPIGALIGAAVGQTLDSGLERLQGQENEDSPDQERMQLAFFTATFATLGHLAKVDGQVTRDEIGMASAVMEQMQLSPAQRKAAIELFNQGKDPNYDLVAVIDQFRHECRRRTNLMRLFMEIQLQGAYADRLMHEREKKLLQEICAMLRFPAFVFDQMEALARASAASAGSQQQSTSASQVMTLASAYQLLGVSASSDKAEVKRAYRKGMSQHHPDKLVARGLPPEMLEVATEKTQKISQAYDLIKESRGW